MSLNGKIETDPLIGSALGDFTIQEKLGQGGFGAVYKVYDRKHDSVVALKILRQFLIKESPDALYRFKKEFRALADVTHPNLVTLYELMSDGEKWFFTMELVEGVDFLEFVLGDAALKQKGSSIHGSSAEDASTMDAPVLDAETIGRLRSAMKQLVEGLCALHEAGKLHRDIKPSNVLVTKEGRVVILDFGLVTETARQGFEQSRENIAGTPAYMSPEQGAGLEVTEAADWYSVGVILYKALTGRFPFSGNLFSQALDKQKFEAPSPSSFVKDLPADLEAICSDLLRRLPEERPSGRETLHRLSGSEVKRQTEAAILSSVQARPFLGRERHMAALKEALQAMKTGRPIAAYVHGSSGMGKTALVRHFLDELEQSKHEVVLTGRCYEHEYVPYKALDSLVDALSRYLMSLPPPEMKPLMPDDILALARLFPVLRRVSAVLEAEPMVLDIPDSHELRRRAFAALRELLTRIAKTKPLVLFIDDLHWGDVDSAALLSELLRPPDLPTLLLIGSYRSEEAQTSSFLRIFFSSQSAYGSAVEVREIVVGELSSAEARELAFALLGKEHETLTDQVDAIARESGGSPLFVDEFVRYSQTHDDAQIRETRMGKVIQSRVSQLPDDARRLLEIVALAGQPLETEVIKHAAELKDEHKALALLRANHLIRATGEGEKKIETYHDRIRETVTADLPSEILKAHHLHLALALETYGGADPERLAVHFQGAGDIEKAAEYAVSAADQASEALAFNRAAQLYRLALELRPAEGSEAKALQVNLGEALVNAGRGAEAAVAFLAAAKTAGAVESLELQRRASEQLIISGHLQEGISTLRDFLQTVGMKFEEKPWRALLSLLFRRAQIRLRGLNFRERDATEISADELLQIDTCWSAAMGLALVDTIRGADFQSRHLLLALKAGEPFRIVRAIALETAYSAASGGQTQKRTEKLLKMGAELAEQINLPYTHALIGLIAGFAAFQEGRWKKAPELMKRAEEIMRNHCTGVAWEIDNAQYYSLCSMQHMGEFREIFSRLPALLKDAQERGDLYFEIFLRTRYLYAEFLAADESDKAGIELRQAMERWRQEGFHHQQYLELLGEVQIALYSDFGEGPKAWNRIVDRWQALEQSSSRILLVQVVRIEAYHLRARSALAAAATASNHEPLLVAAERDAHRMEREKTPWGTALAKLIRAGVAARRGFGKEALSLFEFAEEGLEAVDMRLYAAAARRRRGEMIGGDRGRSLTEAADAWMVNQQIKNPVRMAAMLATGKANSSIVKAIA